MADFTILLRRDHTPQSFYDVEVNIESSPVDFAGLFIGLIATVINRSLNNRNAVVPNGFVNMSATLSVVSM